MPMDWLFFVMFLVAVLGFLALLALIWWYQVRNDPLSTSSEIWDEILKSRRDRPGD